jgi:hypothetical protein
MGPMMPSPPLPPDVVRQQTPPAMQFMQNAGANLQQFNALDLVKERMQQVVTLLKDVADILATERPALIKHLQIMAQAGSSIMNEIQAGSQQAAPQQQMPQPEDASGMVSMS